jgi:hypothetical protein
LAIETLACTLAFLRPDEPIRVCVAGFRPDEPIRVCVAGLL